MKIASVAEIKSQFSAFLKASEAGPVVVTRNGKPVAVIVAVQDEDEIERLLMAYSPRLQKQFSDAARNVGIHLHQGVYAAVIGPQYETAAEVRMLQKLGADAVGMSTVPEVIQAHALEMEVAGFSCIANLATGLSSTALSHDEVLETGANAAKEFSRATQVMRAIEASSSK